MRNSTGGFQTQVCLGGYQSGVCHFRIINSQRETIGAGSLR